MKKSIALPLGTVLVALQALVFRQKQLSNAKDPVTQLYEANATETLLLMGLLVLFLVAIGGLLASGGRPLPNYTYTVYCPNQLFITAVATGSLLLLLSTLVGLMDIKGQYDNFVASGVMAAGGTFSFPFATALGILATAMSGGVMLFLGKNAYRGEEMTLCYLTTIPAFLSVVRLISQYHVYGATPNVQDSFYPVFATLATTMALYHLSATAYLGPRPRLIIFFSLASVVLSAVVMASGIPLYELMVYGGLNLYLLAFAAATIENTYSAREDYRTPPVPEGESFFTDKNETETNKEDENP